MLKIGLTGGIASGKSTVAKMLHELGAEIINADLIGHEISEPGLPAWQQLIAEFGDAILLPDQQINRKLLGTIIFRDPQARARLNAIMHPLIADEVNKRFRDYAINGVRVAVLEAALLIEAGWQSYVDQVWLVVATIEKQMERLMQRNNLTYDEALLRIKAQLPVAAKIKYADVVIENSGSLAATAAQVKANWVKKVNLI